MKPTLRDISTATLVIEVCLKIESMIDQIPENATLCGHLEQSLRHIYKHSEATREIAGDILENARKYE